MENCWRRADFIKISLRRNGGNLKIYDFQMEVRFANFRKYMHRQHVHQEVI